MFAPRWGVPELSPGVDSGRPGVARSEARKGRVSREDLGHAEDDLESRDSRKRTHTIIHRLAARTKVEECKKQCQSGSGLWALLLVSAKKEKEGRVSREDLGFAEGERENLDP